MAERPAAYSALGFCPRLQRSGYISSSWPPVEPAPLPIQVLGKYMLGVLLTSRGLGAFIPLCPLMVGVPKPGPLQLKSPGWYLAHSRHSSVDWTDV